MGIKLGNNWFLFPMDEKTEKVLKNLFKRFRMARRRKMRCLDGQTRVLWPCKMETIHLIKDKVETQQEISYKIFFRLANRKGNPSRKIAEWNDNGEEKPVKFRMRRSAVHMET